MELFVAVAVPFTRTESVVHPPSAEQTLVVPDPFAIPVTVKMFPLTVAVRFEEVEMVL